MAKQSRGTQGALDSWVAASVRSSRCRFPPIDQRSPSDPSSDMLEPETQERMAVTLGPGIFYKSRSSRARPYEQYRLDGESVICERITPNPRSSGAPHVKLLQSWTVAEFTAANVPPPAKTSFQELLRERHKP
jgi:hypothetical protein